MKRNRTQDFPPLNMIHVEFFPISERTSASLHYKIKFTQFTRFHAVTLEPLLQACLMNKLECAGTVARRYQKFWTYFFAVTNATHQHVLLSQAASIVALIV